MGHVTALLRVLASCLGAVNFLHEKAGSEPCFRGWSTGEHMSERNLVLLDRELNADTGEMLFLVTRTILEVAKASIAAATRNKNAHNSPILRLFRKSVTKARLRSVAFF